MWLPATINTLRVRQKRASHITTLKVDQDRHDGMRCMSINKRVANGHASSSDDRFPCRAVQTAMFDRGVAMLIREKANVLLRSAANQQLIDARLELTGYTP